MVDLFWILAGAGALALGCFLAGVGVGLMGGDLARVSDGG